jgi:hypothetical protein
MYIEDLIIQLARFRNSIKAADMTIINSFSDQFICDTGLTEKQSQLAIRLLTRYRQLFPVKIDDHLLNPAFRLKVRKSISEHTVKISTSRPGAPVIELRFPYNDGLVNEIRRYKGADGKNDQISWDRDATAWVFNLSEDNLRFLANFCGGGNYTFDETFSEYIKDTNLILSKIEDHAPILSVIDGTLKIVNSPKNTPEIDTDDILEAVFSARNMGITLWDDAIGSYLDTGIVNPLVKNFLKSDISEQFKISSEETGISALKTVLQYNGPALVIIPGGGELEKTKVMYDILKGIGIEEKNMSVLFRLPSETGKIFNDFVKNQGLNGPISDETKIVFVSTKLPKPLIKSKIKFNSVINMGYSMAHYTLKQYTKNHQNFINFGVSHKHEEFDFGKL